MGTKIFLKIYSVLFSHKNSKNLKVNYYRAIFIIIENFYMTQKPHILITNLIYLFGLKLYYEDYDVEIRHLCILLI